jgi:flagellar biosynthetic protein FliP
MSRDRMAEVMPVPAARRALPWKLALAWALCALPVFAWAQNAGVSIPGVDIRLGSPGNPQETATALKIFLTLTVLSLAPAILISVTAFCRIVIVLSILRHAIGMQETPPNAVLVSLALFLTLFTMSPTIGKINDDAFRPFMDGRISLEKAVPLAAAPLRDFMIRQTREQDMQLMLELAKAETPRSVEEVRMVHLIPAFMLSELKTAFQIGFVIFLPFLLVDLVVSSLLMSMGMMMVPPSTISLPIKILVFVLIDGWSLLARSLLASFH